MKRIKADNYGEVEEKQFDLVVDEGETKAHPRQKKQGAGKGQGGGWKYLSLAGELGFDIAIPMVAGLVIGERLDKAWGTAPRMTLGLFVAGLILACASLIRIVRDVFRKG